MSSLLYTLLKKYSLTISFINIVYTTKILTLRPLYEYYDIK